MRRDEPLSVGIPLTIFSLYRLDGDGDACPHHLLLRVCQAGYNNADEGEYDAVVDAAEAKRRAMLGLHAEMLAKECAVSHAATLVGELESRPVGEALLDGPGGAVVELWVAQTRFGAPWVVLGTAESEDAFWRAAEDDDDLSRLGAVGPAARLRAFFLADEEDPYAGPTA